jgi:hypothetical protein
MCPVGFYRQCHIKTIVHDQERPAFSGQRAQGQPFLDEQAGTGCLVTQLDDRSSSIKGRCSHREEVTPARPITIG